ncbi:hypothetical protein CMQ_5011 [Grosmannia clavigera kw1407]|uniref:Uncharacterized protein n=1 Tax=Grosmannia clavigera (strain kw1407 / UAMH 11150) TaxID=655863 RepID=F0XK76_GROCL|nr:uncharacterized protein CMQ_5011 [Grosmannia clavigera kw1407]EFX01940.1 hypothetical protein CMQ_5011 [Grosmannia clavigera kw1407]
MLTSLRKRLNGMTLPILSGNNGTKHDATEATDGDGPSFADVLVVKAMMGQAFHLPLELVDEIVDLAEYWPHTTTCIDYRQTELTEKRIGSQNQNVMLFRTPPLGFERPPHADEASYTTEPLEPAQLQQEYGRDELVHWLGRRAPALEHPCRKIRFRLISHDQGWGGGGPKKDEPYKASYSWFDVGLERYDAVDVAGTSVLGSDTPPRHHALRSVQPAVRPAEDDPVQLTLHHPMLPSSQRLQSNRTAVRTATTHDITWSWLDRLADDPAARDDLERLGRGPDTADGAFVRDLRVGDVVTLWAKARFPGWANVVELAQVDVYWAV